MRSASVVILTKNGSRYLPQLLDALFSQTAAPEEVIAIDSGSKDSTLEILARYNVKVHRIKPHDFDHGETRNLGAELSKGEFIAFLTQDAIPASERWLERLLAPFEDERVAGAYCRHIPRDGCHHSERRQIVEFDLIGREKRIVNSAENNLEFRKNPQRYAFFANTASCIRRSVWKRFPFKKMNFAEDQEWAWRVITAGYKTVYEPSAAVIHSHNYPPLTNLKRNFDHAMAMKELFGYADISNPLKIPFRVLREVKRDASFMRANGISRLEALKWSLYGLVWHSAKDLGQVAGANHHFLPAWAKRWFSLQEEIKSK